MDSEKKLVAPTFEEIKKQWANIASVYIPQDSTAQTFYFSLINILKLQEAKNILEVGCGRCALLPYTFQLKNPEASYLATDISEVMIEKAHQYLQAHLAMYESKLTYEEWLVKNKTTVKVANGEEPFNEDKKFDRIICNMVLMLTENAQNMLNNLANQAESGCLIGISVWGNPELNKYFGYLVKSTKQLGFPTGNMRSNHYLYKKVGEVAQKTGWEVIVSWEQSSSIPFFEMDNISKFAKSSTSRMKHLNEQQQKAVYDLYIQKIQKELKEEKKGLTMPVELYVLRKK